MIFIINSAPGVGKTTLLKNLQKMDMYGYGVLDGDDIGRTLPLRNTIEWLNMIQDNIVSCCINFHRYDIKNVIVSFVFPSEERIQRLVGLLKENGFKVCHIILYCGNDIISKRITGRNTSKLVGIERAVECNNLIRELNSDFSIDTSFISEDETADKIYDFLMHFNYQR